MKYNMKLIDDYRQKNNLSVKKFCERCKLSKSVYYRLKHNQGFVRISSVYKMFEVTKISSDAFFYNEIKNKLK